MYSFAIVMWEIWSRQVPWSGLRPMQIMKKVDKGERPPIPAGMPAELRELMVRAWAHDAAERPTFEELAAKLKVSKIDLSKLAFVRTLKGHSDGVRRAASAFCRTFVICLHCRSLALPCFRTGGASCLRRTTRRSRCGT